VVAGRGGCPVEVKDPGNQGGAPGSMTLSLPGTVQQGWQHCDKEGAGSRTSGGTQKLISALPK
jgi:hypothetical protein